MIALPLIILYQRSTALEREYLIEVFKKDKRTLEDFKKIITLITQKQI